jgi:hypothetical protein
VKTLAAALLVIAVVAPLARGDVGFFPHSHTIPISPRNAVPIVVEVRDDLKEPRLLVPRKLTAQAIPAGSPSAPRRIGAVALPLVAGSALALTFAGLCLARGTRFRGMVMLALASIALGGAILIAHPPPPPMAPFKYDTLPPLDGVVVELTNDGDQVRLQLPRAVAVDLAEMLTAREWSR